MELLIDLWPFWLLIAFSVFVIWRGMRNSTHDNDTGGQGDTTSSDGD